MKRQCGQGDGRGRNYYRSGVGAGTGAAAGAGVNCSRHPARQWGRAAKITQEINIQVGQRARKGTATYSPKKKTNRSILQTGLSSKFK